MNKRNTYADLTNRRAGRRTHFTTFCCATLLLSLLLAGCAGTPARSDVPADQSASANPSDNQPADISDADGQPASAQPADAQSTDNQTANHHSASGHSKEHHSADAPTADVSDAADPSASAQTTGGQPTDNRPDAEPAPDAQNTQPAANTQAADSPSDSALEQAKSAVLEHVKLTEGLTAADITFMKEELDYDDGIAAYEIEFVTDTHKYEFKVRAEDNAILKSSVETIERLQRTANEVISPEEARDIALRKASLTADQVNFTQVELDYHPADNAAAYEIEFYANGTEYEITIDAVSGKILEFETDID